MLLYNIFGEFNHSIYSHLSYYIFHPSHLPIHQADLDAVRVDGRAGQNIFDDALGQLAGRLVLFQDNADALSGFDICAICTVHFSNSIFSGDDAPCRHPFLNALRYSISRIAANPEKQRTLE